MGLQTRAALAISLLLLVLHAAVALDSEPGAGSLLPAPNEGVGAADKGGSSGPAVVVTDDGADGASRPASSAAVEETEIGVPEDTVTDTPPAVIREAGPLMSSTDVAFSVDLPRRPRPGAAAAAAAATLALPRASPPTGLVAAASAVEVETVKANSVVLQRHNQYRALHQAPPLKWSKALAAAADAWAAKCAFEHDPDTPYGENLFIINKIGDPGGFQEAAVQMWYAEADDYSFSKPGFDMSTGHFTQLVWVATKQLGCAYRECRSGIKSSTFTQGTLVVCRYNPPGNMPGRYTQMVKPVKSAGFLPLLPPSAPAPAPAPAAPLLPERLPSGSMFRSPGCLVSPNRRFKLCLENQSGLLVLQQVDVQPAVGLWSSSANSKQPRPFSVTLTPDGVLAVYDRGASLVWASSNKKGTGTAPYTAVLQDAGRLAVLDSKNQELWSSDADV